MKLTNFDWPKLESRTNFEGALEMGLGADGQLRNCLHTPTPSKGMGVNYLAATECVPHWSGGRVERVWTDDRQYFAVVFVAI